MSKLKLCWMLYLCLFIALACGCVALRCGTEILPHISLLKTMEGSIAYSASSLIAGDVSHSDRCPFMPFGLLIENTTDIPVIILSECSNGGYNAVSFEIQDGKKKVMYERKYKLFHWGEEKPYVVAKGQRRFIPIVVNTELWGKEFINIVSDTNSSCSIRARLRIKHGDTTKELWSEPVSVVELMAVNKMKEPLEAAKTNNNYEIKVNTQMPRGE